MRPAPLMLAVSLVTAPAAALDWTHFRFDERHTGFQPHETQLTDKTVKFAHFLWQAELGGELVFGSSPAVVKGVVYIANVNGFLVAYDAKGCGSDFCEQPLWTSTYLAQIVDSPAVANGVLYIGSQTDDTSNDGKLDAFAAAGCGEGECAPLWQGDAGRDSILESSPTVWNGVVFVGSYGGKLFAFDADGCGQALCQPLWTGKLGGPTESTPVVHRGVVYIAADDGKLYAFKARGCGRRTKCKPLWTADIHGSAFVSSPAIDGGKVYVNSDHALSVFDAAGCGQAVCAPLWQAIDDDDFFGGSPAVANGLVYVPLESQLNAYDAAGCGKKLCSAKFILEGSGMQDAIGSAPTVAGGVVYAGRNSGEVLGWPAAGCGKTACLEIWKGFTNDPIVNSSPTVVDGHVYIGGSDHGFHGRLYVYGL
ncbi:MAG TPA: PQQ-binding-like beta-propeller repeat protein [Rhizomicrobium sp.]|nr:PQQ-binding-like beta-propeller repeat protein [Rhizomicrobium sp.]